MRRKSLAMRSAETARMALPPWLADGDDVRFQNDLALRLNG